MKHFLFVVLLLMGAMGAFCQENPLDDNTFSIDTTKRIRDSTDGYFAVGIQGGLSEFKVSGNTANSFGDSNFGTFFKAGFNAGIYADFPLVSYFLHVQPEINFTQRGYAASSDAGDFDRTYNFIDIPVLIKVYPYVHRFYLYGGPRFSYLLSTQTTIGNLNDPNSYDKYSHKNSSLKKNQFGISFGFGWEFLPHLFFAAGYDYDFTYNYNPDGIETPVFRNQNFKINLGYRIFPNRKQKYWH